jgi:hypothetical protein
VAGSPEKGRENDPMAYYSTTVVRQFITGYLGNPPILWLYPDMGYLVPLQQLGELAGWRPGEE